MKKLFTAMFLLGCFALTRSQSLPVASHTLSYSQALILKSGTAYTVPVGAVWKITGLAANTPNSSNNNAPNVSITPVGGSAVTVYMGQTNLTNNGGAAYLTASPFPMWLQEGTAITPGGGSTALMFGVEFQVN